MPTTAADPSRPETRSEIATLFAIASIVALVHCLTNSRYGFHRDELQFLSDARHMDWGFVAYPPFTPFVENISMHLFGLNMVGLRLFSVLFQCGAIILSGLMAFELGGSRLAQIATAVSVALSPLPMFEATEFQYSSFDFFWWVLIAYCVIRLLKSENPRWWLAIGAATGLALLTKYSVIFFIAGILAGVVLSSARRYLKSPWFWSAIAIAFLLCLPNLIWQIHHDFISYRFLQHIHIRDVRNGRANGFVRGQFIICANLISAALWIPGLFGYFRDRRYRMLAWMYVVPLAFFIAAKGRDYYLAAAYPMLIAMGAVMAERWLSTLTVARQRAAKAAYFAALTACGLLFAAVLIPLAPSGRLKNFALSINGDLREEFGWHELVATVASIRDSLPADQQQNLGVLVGNYGERGALEIFGPAYHLPLPINMTNSAWLRGYPDPPPTTLIVVGISRKGVDELFTDCRWAGHNGNSEGVKNEESLDHPDIFLCGPPRKPWPEFWKDNLWFG